MSSEHDHFSSADDALQNSTDSSENLRNASERAFDEVYKDMGKPKLSTTCDTAVAEKSDQGQAKQEESPTQKQDVTPDKKEAHSKEAHSTEAPSKDARPSEVDKPEGIITDKAPKPDDRSSDRSNEDPRLKERRERLDAAADENITDPKEREQFRENMRKFEERAKNEKLSPDEVSNTYAAIERLLTAKQTDNALPDEDHRAILAQNFMYHAADPTNIDQGTNNTCNVTTMQEKIMTKNPSVAADMLSSAATTGKYISKSPDRTEIKLDPLTMQPYRGLDGAIPKDNDRSYATQVLNHVLANEISQRRQPPEYYLQVRHDLQHGDNGERLRTEGFNGPDKMIKRDEVLKEPYVTTEEMSKAIERHIGEKGSTLWPADADTEWSFKSAESLRDKIETAKKEGRLPLILCVNGDDPLFNGQPNEKSTSYESHVVCVTGINEKGEVQISNQWGMARDMKVDINRLYKATTQPEPLSVVRETRDGALHTIKTYEGRKDGLVKQHDIQRGDWYEATKEYTPGNAKGVLQETFKRQGDSPDYVCTRTLDPTKNDERLISERLSHSDGVLRKEYVFEGRKDGMKTESSVKGPNGEQIIQTFNDGTKTETTIATDGKKTIVAYDKDGKVIKK